MILKQSQLISTRIFKDIKANRIKANCLIFLQIHITIKSTKTTKNIKNL